MNASMTRCIAKLKIACGVLLAFNKSKLRRAAQYQNCPQNLGTVFTSVTWLTMRAWPVARSIFDAPLANEGTTSERGDNKLDKTLAGLWSRCRSPFLLRFGHGPFGAAIPLQHREAQPQPAMHSCYHRSTDKRLYHSHHGLVTDLHTTRIEPWSSAWEASVLATTPPGRNVIFLFATRSPALSNLLSARSLLSHSLGSIEDAARDGPCAHGKARPREIYKKLHMSTYQASLEHFTWT